MPDLSLVRPLPGGLPWPSKPTLLHAVSAADYRADLHGDVPTASRSCLHTLLTVSPRHAAAEHPRLPGLKVKKSSKAMDAGALVHALLLGGEEQIVIVEEKNFLKESAIAKRNEALAAGLVPICRPQYQEVAAITHRLALEILDVAADLAGVTGSHWQGCKADAGDAPCTCKPAGLAWRDLAKEVTCLWNEDLVPFAPDAGETVRCRARFDLALISHGIVFDLKTVTKGYAVADPFIRAMNSEQSSLPMQAAFYQRGFEAVHPELAGRSRFIFLRVEIRPPYTVLAIEAGGSIRQLGEDRLNRALPGWARCLESGVWPGPQPVIAQAEPWAIQKELYYSATREIDEQEEGGDDVD